MDPCLLKDISDNRAKVLFAVVQSENLTKSEIKQTTALSMSTVISAVDALVSEGLLTFAEEKGAHGGKPRSVINFSPDACVYGVSYKAGELTAVVLDLAGKKRTLRRASVAQSGSPERSLLSLLEDLRRHTVQPLAMALALRCEDPDPLADAAERAVGVPPVFLSNTAALAYRSYLQQADLPVAVIGIGRDVKCACLEKSGCRYAELGDLPSAPVFTEEGSYRSLLCSPGVREALERGEYHGLSYVKQGKVSQTKDLAEYSEALAVALSSAATLVRKVLSPRRILLFGDYLTPAFFQRVRQFFKGDVPLEFLQPNREDFACGAALAALWRGVFS